RRPIGSPIRRRCLHDTSVNAYKKQSPAVDAGDFFIFRVISSRAVSDPKGPDKDVRRITAKRASEREQDLASYRRAKAPAVSAAAAAKKTLSSATWAKV